MLCETLVKEVIFLEQSLKDLQFIYSTELMLLFLNPKRTSGPNL